MVEGSCHRRLPESTVWCHTPVIQHMEAKPEAVSRSGKVTRKETIAGSSPEATFTYIHHVHTHTHACLYPVPTNICKHTHTSTYVYSVKGPLTHSQFLCTLLGLGELARIFSFPGDIHTVYWCSTHTGKCESQRPTLACHRVSLPGQPYPDQKQ